MKIATIDNIKLLLEVILQDYYLKTHFALRFSDLKIQQPFETMVSDFAKFRNSIKDEKKEKDTKENPLLEVTRTIDLRNIQ